MNRRLTIALLLLGVAGCADSNNPDFQGIDIGEVPDLGGGSDVALEDIAPDAQLDTGLDVGQDVVPDTDAGPMDADPTDAGMDAVTDADVCLPSTEVCDGQDNDCDGLTDEGEDGTALTQTCYEGPAGTDGAGICTPGTQTCFEGAYGACQGSVEPRAETCDSLDNDCNGVADDIAEGTCDCEPSSVRDCYDGPEGTAGVAACAAGTQTCRADGTTWEPCVGQMLPATEVCDAVDNDCDGTTDNVENEGTACAAGTGACERGGVYVCDVDRAELVCDAIAGEPGIEVCDLVDNDCDTFVDNVTGLGDFCTVGIGACQAEGVRVCDTDFGELTCNGTEFSASVETCDGIDNDCDTLVDEAADGSPLTTTCYTGPSSTVDVGICRSGTATCVEGSFGPCVGETLPMAEICDTVDNDCDGTPDNRAVGTCVCEPSTTRSCYGGPAGTSDVGVCVSGMQTCAADGGAWGPCEGQTLPSSEVCDGLDNDCDGSLNEGNPGGDATCDTGRNGVCAAGTTNCEDGAIACTQNVASSAEVCDGVDNDCDGSLDEGNPGGGATCSTGRLGVCAAGTTVCQSGSVACNQNVPSSAEICDGLDNNCNGGIDEGNPGGGATCSTGLQGVCGGGTTSCSDGSLMCNQNTASSAEICDSLDNDCDGLADDISVTWTTSNHPAALGCVDLAVGDINGDSRPDVVCAPQITAAVNPDTRLHYYVQNASGTFESVQYTPAVPEGPFRQPSQIALADLDRDGDLDLVTAGETQRIWVLRNSSGAFGTPQLAFDFTASAERGTGGLIVRDFNGDTFLDIVTVVGTVRDGSSWRLALALGVGDGTFQAPIISSTSGARSAELQEGDVDRDGDLDVIGLDGTRIIRWNYASGSFGAPTTVVNLTTFAPHLNYGDINGDTFGDILVPGVELFTVVPGTATGFDTATTTAVPGIVQAVRVGGFDCDSTPELALLTSGGQPLYIYTDAATLTNRIPALTTFGRAMHVGDMNGDGLDDIIVGRPAGDGGGITVNRQAR